VPVPNGRRHDPKAALRDKPSFAAVAPRLITGRIRAAGSAPHGPALVTGRFDDKVKALTVGDLLALAGGFWARIQQSVNRLHGGLLPYRHPGVTDRVIDPCYAVAMWQHRSMRR
jgi:hypothetical protein